jgi:hypothetical protein
MKSENDFNRYLSKEFRTMRNLMCIKTADKYTPGISDFLLWSKGRGAFLETKFIKKIPSTTAKLLRHPFSSKQVSFLKGMTNVAGCPAWGVIGVQLEKKIYAFPSWMIPSEGNWIVEEFLRMKSKLDQTLYNDERAIKIYTFDQIADLIVDMFAEESKPIFRGPIIHVD